MLKVVGGTDAPAPAKRLKSVLSALEAQRPHIEALDDDDADIGNYNRWIALLDGVVAGNWQSLLIDDTMISAREYLMHLDAAIAFLKAEIDG